MTYLQTHGFYPASPGQAEPPAVHRLLQSTGQKPGPTSLHEKKGRNEKKISDKSKNFLQNEVNQYV